MSKKIPQYRDGGDGFIKWVEDNVCLPVYPPGSKISQWVPVSKLPKAPDRDTGRSYWDFWENQKDILREALRMEGDRFVYRLIILCWMRGEGKTFTNCLFQMWRFFCWPKQTIILCANSKDQTEFISFNTIKNIILNSPRLRRIVGVRNIQKRVIRLRDASHNITSVIMSVSSFSGFLPNIDSFSFTEIHEMKSPDFFQEIYGSIRNIPNAIGFIDSTVSPKDHILYRQYEAFKKKKDPMIFFSYRFSKQADYRDYWHPLQTQVQLDSYRTSFLPGAFDRYFKNLWTVGADKVFEAYQIEAINYIGAAGSTLNQGRVFDLIKQKQKILSGYDQMAKKGLEYHDRSKDLNAIEAELWSVDDEYVLSDSGFHHPRPASVEMLERMGMIYNTDWAIIAGIDRAQPMKMRTAARTIYIVMAKGLPGSKSDATLGTLSVPNYIYLVMHLIAIPDHSIEGLKAEILLTNEEYDGVDRISSETWGVFDMVGWCEDNDIVLDMITATYPKQLAAFTELYQVISTGRFKSPSVGISGSKGGDILMEELGLFDHDEEKKRFGSPEKKRRYGIQDDCIYAMGLCIYGGRVVTVDHFRPRSGLPDFGTAVAGTGTVGKY